MKQGQKGQLSIDGSTCDVCGTRGDFNDTKLVAPGDVLLTTCPNGHITAWSIGLIKAAAKVKMAKA